MNDDSDSIMSTTHFEPGPTLTAAGSQRRQVDPKLMQRYIELTKAGKVSWMGYYHFQRLIGRGGQGEVYLSEFRGTDNFTIPVAVKVFSPERYGNMAAYSQAMERVASMAAQIALIQHDNLLNVQTFFERRGIRCMMMEWIDGFDLRYLVDPPCLDGLKTRISPRRWRYINEVILTSGPQQSRFKPGMAVAIVRECLAALAALHRSGIIHGDLKPSNIMLKRTGHAKLIDMGSAIDYRDPPPHRDCTPMYAAPEVLEDQPPTPLSDLASLGYVLIELLAGRNPFHHDMNIRELLSAKRKLPQMLPSLLPDDVSRNELLLSFLNGLIAPDVNRRFSSADEAQSVDQGATAFLRQLVFGELDTDYDNDARIWLEELRLLRSETESGDGVIPTPFRNE